MAYLLVTLLPQPVYPGGQRAMSGSCPQHSALSETLPTINLAKGQGGLWGLSCAAWRWLWTMRLLLFSSRLLRTQLLEGSSPLERQECLVGELFSSIGYPVPSTECFGQEPPHLEG